MPDSRPATIRDVAAHAGVAVSSVSRALSGHPDVSAAMRARVQAAADEVGYVPDLVARSLRSNTTGVVGLLVRDYTNPLFGQIIHGIEAVLDRSGYTLIIASSGNDADREARLINVLRQRRVDALLLSTVSDSAPRTLEAVARYERPVVLLDRDLPGVTAPRVLIDHARGVQDAVSDLLSHGHSRIALITGSEDVRPTRERVRGFDAAYRTHAVAARFGTRVTGVFSADFARTSTVSLLAAAADRRPTAFVAGGVQATIGVLEAFSDLGLRAGIDVAMVSCDDVPWLAVMRPAISAVARDAEEFGRAAAELVTTALRGDEATTIVLATTYLARETTSDVGSPSSRRRSGTDQAR